MRLHNILALVRAVGWRITRLAAWTCAGAAIGMACGAVFGVLCGALWDLLHFQFGAVAAVGACGALAGAGAGGLTGFFGTLWGANGELPSASGPESRHQEGNLAHSAADAKLPPPDFLGHRFSDAASLEGSSEERQGRPLTMRFHH
jgi:hypothetical protein